MEMLMETNEKLEHEIQDLKPTEFVALTKLYTGKDFPFNSSTLRDIMTEVQCSKPTATRLLANLKEKNLIKEVRDFIVFYYPVADQRKANMIRKAIFIRLGIL